MKTGLLGVAGAVPEGQDFGRGNERAEGKER